MQHLSFAEKIRSLAILAITFFAFSFLFIAPLELLQVYRVESWIPVPAQLTSVHIERVRGKGVADVLFYEFQDLESGKKVRLTDARPGDFLLFSGVLQSTGWTSLRSEEARYQGVSKVTVYRSPEKELYYMERGSYGLMTTLWFLAIAWWVGLLWRAVSGRETQGAIGSQQGR